MTTSGFNQLINRRSERNVSSGHQGGKHRIPAAIDAKTQRHSGGNELALASEHHNQAATPLPLSENHGLDCGSLSGTGINSSPIENKPISIFPY